MGVNYIALSIPVFFALIALEWAVSRLRGVQVYRLNDSLADLACGILQQVMTLFVGGLLLGHYVLWFEHARVMEPVSTSSTAAWVACFVLVDVAYYFFHRWSHESALGWVSHVVHHQSEDYNLAVALRQDAFQQFFSHLFYLPLAVLGFPPVMFATCAAFNTLYQFWIHTRLVGKLGPLEWVLNTPSHHRVHHGTNLEYLDRNYAGVFITWDRLFGTFEPERAPPRYGVLEPVRSWNPLWAHVQYPVALWRKVRAQEGAWNALQALFRAPGWSAVPDPSALAGKVQSLAHAPLYDARAAAGGGAYAAAAFVSATAVLTFLLFERPALPPVAPVLGALLVTWTLLNVGAFFDRRPWLRASESLRLLAGVASGAAGALLLSGMHAGACAAYAGAQVVLAAWLAARGRAVLAPA